MALSVRLAPRAAAIAQWRLHAASSVRAASVVLGAPGSRAAMPRPAPAVAAARAWGARCWLPHPGLTRAPAGIDRARALFTVRAASLRCVRPVHAGGLVHGHARGRARAGARAGALRAHAAARGRRGRSTRTRLTPSRPHPSPKNRRWALA